VAVRIGNEVTPTPLVLSSHRRRGTVVGNTRRFEKHDDENQTAWHETDQSWWCWWNNDIEANAWILKAIVAENPKDPAAPKLIKWLLNNRHHGYYWRSTRDTAVCATAFIDYRKAVGEDRPNYTLRLKYDGQPLKEGKITPANFLVLGARAFDNQLTIAGDALEGGRHTLRLERVGLPRIRQKPHARSEATARPRRATVSSLRGPSRQASRTL